MEPFSNKNTKNRTEHGWKNWKKNEWITNDLAQGPRSRTEGKDFKKAECAQP